MHKIIGITGKAGAGKDTIYEILEKQFAHYPLNRLAFADLLKESAMASLGLEYRAANAFKKSGSISIKIGDTEFDMTGREYLQRYGAEAHREIFGKDFWIDAAFERLQKGVTIVTDVRFDNEAAAIHEFGGIIWKVERPGDGIEESEHSSEQGVSDDLIDQFILNDGTIDYLRTQVLWAWGDYREYPHVLPWNHNPKQEIPLDQIKYTQEELDHNFLKRKEIAELFNIPIEVLSNYALEGVHFEMIDGRPVNSSNVHLKPRAAHDRV
jgi:hypothetical protein